MRTACSAGLSIGTGSLKNTIIASPAKRSSVPSCSSTSVPIARVVRAQHAPSPPRARRVSVNAVKPRRSRNTTVISRRCVLSRSSPLPATIASASCGEKKLFSRRLELRHLRLHACPARSALAPRPAALDAQQRRTRASSSGWLIGLERKSSAPASMPFTRSWFGSSAVHHHHRQQRGFGIGADRACTRRSRSSPASSRRAAPGRASPSRSAQRLLAAGRGHDLRSP